MQDALTAARRHLAAIQRDVMRGASEGRARALVSADQVRAARLAALAARDIDRELLRQTRAVGVEAMRQAREMLAASRDAMREVQ